MSLVPVPAPALVEPLLDGVEAPVLGGTVELLLEPLLLGVVLLLGVALLLGVVLPLGVAPELEAVVPELEAVVLGVVLLLLPLLLPLEGVLISSNLLSKLLLLLL